jgi:very-short-patch-repair endonuclease
VEVSDRFDLLALIDQIERNNKRPGAAILKRLLEEHSPGRTATWSELEERFLRLIRDARVPEPEVNAWVMLPDGERPIRVDFLWRAQRLVVETDGYRTHKTRQAFEHDRRNDQRLAAAFFNVIRPRGASSETSRAGSSRQSRRCSIYESLEPCKADHALTALEGACDLKRYPPPEASELSRKPSRFANQRGHLHSLQPARDDPAKWLQIVLDIDRKAVSRHAARDVDADRGNLPLANPDAGEIGPLVRTRSGSDPLQRQRFDESPLERADVADHVVQSHDRISDELSRTVVGDSAPAVGVDHIDALHQVPLFAHRQLARL